MKCLLKDPPKICEEDLCVYCAQSFARGYPKPVETDLDQEIKGQLIVWGPKGHSRWCSQFDNNSCDCGYKRYYELMERLFPS